MRNERVTMFVYNLLISPQGIEKDRRGENEGEDEAVKNVSSF